MHVTRVHAPWLPPIEFCSAYARHCVIVSSQTKVLSYIDHISRVDHTQAGGFLPRLLEQTGLLESSDDILDLNVILVYKKLVQGLIYSPSDCDKYLALDASPQVKVLVTLAPRLTPYGARKLCDSH